jgi:hypothetical protein
MSLVHSEESQFSDELKHEVGPESQTRQPPADDVPLLVLADTPPY